MNFKFVIASIAGAMIFAGALSAGMVRVPHWDSATSIKISHLGIGTSADCTVTYYNQVGGVAGSTTHTFTARHQSRVFAPPSSGGGYAVIFCEEQAIAHGYFINGSQAFSVPINGGIAF